MVSYFPYASRSSHLTSMRPSVVDAFFWLVVVWAVVNRGPSTGNGVFHIYFFHRLNSRPKDGTVSPIRSNPSAPPLRHPSHRGRRLLVDCCVSLLNSGNLRPRPGPSLCFLMGLFLAPQTRELMAERAKPTPCACPWWIGTSGTKSWVRGRFCHGDRGEPVEGRVTVGSFWLRWKSRLQKNTVTSTYTRST